jgi:outer membrane receptor protein involved in Fe transport
MKTDIMVRFRIDVTAAQDFRKIIDGKLLLIGASWRITQEEFMKNVTWINNLRLRVSYGETGNDSMDSYYPYQTLYDLGVNNGTEAGAYFSNLANPNLVWETQVSSDVALEFTIFDKLTGVVEYFRKDSKDLLFPVSLPASTGVTSQTQNIGKVRINGFEWGLDYQILKQKDWRLSAGINGTFLVNKIIKFLKQS